MADARQVGCATSPMAASSVGYTMAVPTPSSTAPVAKPTGLTKTDAGSREIQREQAPHHAIVEIVDESCLSDAGEISISDGRSPKDLSSRRQCLRRQGGALRGFSDHVLFRLANRE